MAHIKSVDTNYDNGVCRVNPSILFQLKLIEREVSAMAKAREQQPLTEHYGKEPGTRSPLWRRMWRAGSLRVDL